MRNIMDLLHQDSTRLSFATINKLSCNIAEVIVDRNIEIDLNCVEEYHQALLDIFGDAFGLLINKVQPYSYNIDAQFRITSLPQIKAIAIVNYSLSTWAATKALQSIPPNRKKNLQNFWDRNEALSWLIDELVTQ